MNRPHDCDSMSEQIVALLDGELRPADAEAVLEQIAACPVCAAEYRAHRDVVSSFDQFVEAARPEEAFWSGYEARLDARLGFDARRSHHLAYWAAVAASVVIAVALAWTSLRNGAPPRELAAVPRVIIPPAFEPDRRPALPVPRHQPLRRRPSLKQVPMDDSIPAHPAAGPVLARHLDHVALLFRSLDRNGNLSPTDSSRARLLLDSNQLLRREAERQQDAQVERILVRLEPALLDLVHLDTGDAGGVPEPILERIRRQEYLLASLSGPAWEVLP